MDLQNKLSELEQQRQGLLLQIALFQQLAALEGKIELLREMLKEEQEKKNDSATTK